MLTSPSIPERFPDIEPYDSGMLDVGDGQSLYWERVGNPDGLPALYLHGGPGSGSTAGARTYFDPSIWNVLLFDQRGAGRSQPRASSPDADLRVNTTQHLIADIERLRELHGAGGAGGGGTERWVVLGISWGATLAQAYAHAHPERVAGIVLAAVTMTSRREVEWVTEEMRRIFPEAWDALANGIPQSMRHLRIIDAYARLTADPDPAVHSAAARAWCAWEDTHVSLMPGYTHDTRYDDPEFALRFARLVTHYWSNAAFLDDDQLMRDAAALTGIPGILVHGRFDVSGPLDIPWELSKRWTTSELRIVDDAGHGGGSFSSVTTAAVQDMARLAIWT